MEEKKQTIEFVKVVERKCSPTLQPKVKVGEVYPVKGFSQTKDGKQVVVVGIKGTASGTARLNDGRFAWKPYTLDDLHEEKKEQYQWQGWEKCRDMFDKNELTDIVVMPLVLAELVWRYVDRVTAQCAALQLSQFKKLSRQTKQLKTEYYTYNRKTLDGTHLKGIENGKIKVETTLARDLLIFETTIYNDINRDNIHKAYTRIASDAYTAMLMIDFMSRWNWASDQLITERLNVHTENPVHPVMGDVRKLMEQYIFGLKMQVTFSQNMQIGMAALFNKLKTITIDIPTEKIWERST